ncbi:MAG: DNA-3-methyladenine glycosylase [Bacteroidota bacterium]|nr:DNA-3-methyladenine glycosylase [Bacteroidota bacterium]
MKLPEKYYHNEDVVHLAKDLLGKVLITEIDGIRTGGIITETEAYSEIEKGSHAYNKRKTDRTKIMFEKGGLSYVYFCYGMHHLFNVVTGKKDFAQAVLIRAIQPTIGIEDILIRRKKDKVDKNLCNGPGKVCAALGINRQHYGLELSGTKIWIEKSKIKIKEDQIEATPRIGIDYAAEDAALPWRFVLKL